MKKARLVFGVVVMMFAFASAFAFKATPLVENPSYLLNGTCIQVSVTCNGTSVDCVRSISGTNQTIREYVSATSCSTILKMPS